MLQTVLLSNDSLSFSTLIHYAHRFPFSTLVFGFISSFLKLGVCYMYGCVAEAGSIDMGTEKERDGKTVFRIPLGVFEVINSDCQAGLCPIIAGLLAP